MALSLLLRCQNLIHTRDYYRDVLEFEVTETSGLSLVVSRFGVSIMFTELNLWETDLMMSGTIYISVPAVDQYYAEIQEQVDVAWGLQDMPYGTREFAVRDSNGYYLAFMQADT